MGWVAIIVGAGMAVAGCAGAAQPASPEKPAAVFQGADTRRVLGSPDPLPLEPERAFPQLRFERPLELTHAGDGSDRVFVVEQRGVIHVFGNRPDASRTSVFLDIRDVVSRDDNLWSDGAMKQRYLALPRAKSVRFSATGPWQFPEGTVLVKTFFLPATTEAAARPPRAISPADLADPRQWRRLETRLLVHSPEGWQGYTYVWNDLQTDAELLEGAKTVEVEVPAARGKESFSWYFPSRSDCMACHTPAAGFVLRLNTRQLNRPAGAAEVASLGGKGLGLTRPPAAGPAAGSGNQIALWREVGVFTDPPPGPPDSWEAYPDWFTAPTKTASRRELLARAYLDANCAMCHVPDGIVGRPDFRFHTPLQRAQLVGANPGQGRIGPAHSQLVRPGDPESSELLHRLRVRGPRQMPPLASHRVDDQAVALVRQWILDLEHSAAASSGPRR